MKTAFRLVALLVPLLAFGCLPNGNAGTGQGVSQDTDWRDMELTDVSTSQSFALSDFTGKVVVMETMAVWCPTCVRQQIEVQALRDRFGEEVAYVILDIDQNEDEAILRGHVLTHGFSGNFAVSNRALNRALEREFGNVVLNPPSTPVIIIDREQNGYILRPGLKSVSELANEVERYL